MPHGRIQGTLRVLGGVFSAKSVFCPQRFLRDILERILFRRPSARAKLSSCLQMFQREEAPLFPVDDGAKKR